MTPPYIPGDIIKGGAVGRAILQSSDWKKIKNKHAPLSIFLDNKSLMKISVFLLDIVSNEKLTKIGDAMAKSRDAGRSFYGWAEVSVTNASKESRVVRYTPQPANKWHADIVLPDIVSTDKKERERHAEQLADMSIPRPAGPSI